MTASSKNSPPLLVLASTNGNREMVELLLKQGVDAQGSLDALFCTIAFDNCEIAELLLKQGAPVNMKHKDNNTALILATSNGNYEMVELLLKHGARVNGQDENGSTALMLAASNNRLEIASLLLAYGATPLVNADPSVALMSQHLHSALEVALKRPLSADIVPALLKACTLLLRLRRGILCPTDEEVSKWITLINEKHFITEQTDTEQTNLVLSPKLIDLVLPLELILQIRAAWWAQDLASTIAKKYQLKLDDVQPLCKLLEKNTSLLNQLCKVRAHHDWRQPWEPTVTLEPSPSLALR